VDAIGVYCEVLDQTHLLPIDLVADRRRIQLRVSVPKNGQRAALNWASDFELSGAVAQLGRACGWQPQGRGFESHQLHASDGSPKTVGAHEFRNLFGWYAERAAAGEEFLVTRRGKPYVRLSPAQPSLPIAAYTPVPNSSA
jgi:prevent-host-death family protein